MTAPTRSGAPGGLTVFGLATVDSGFDAGDRPGQCVDRVASLSNLVASLQRRCKVH